MPKRNSAHYAVLAAIITLVVCLWVEISPAFAQRPAPRDPAEPQQAHEQQGYTIGGMLDNDIVGADPSPGAPHRVRLFSGNGEIDDCDSPGRELARAIEESDGREHIRMIFRVHRYGRGGDHSPFYKAGLPAVPFTEPLEDYTHQHQTPRTENSIEYGDFAKYLNSTFLGNVARDNAEALRQLAMAPAAPTNAKLTGAVTPDAKVSWTAEDDPERAGFENFIARNNRTALASL